MTEQNQFQLGRIPCTVAILTKNSAASLPRALESAKDFSEIIVCDGGSSDETVKIAEKFGAKVIFQDKKFLRPDGRIGDFAGVRNQTLEASTHKWFFYLDSDEYLSKEVVNEIKDIVETGAVPAAYWIPRKYVVDGKIIERASTYPTNKQVRFFHLDAVTKFIKPIHERIEVRPGAQIKTLQESMLVPMENSPAATRKKWNYYIELELARRGPITFFDWLAMCAENAKISALFAFRFLKNLFFGQGARMPARLEWERHIYHLNICRKFFSKINSVGAASKKLEFLAAFLILVAAFSFCMYRLQESPTTWRDEGIVVQVARNVAESGVYGVLTAPGKFISAGFVTVGPSVVYPIAGAFKIFGANLFVARSVMAGFIILLLLTAFFLIRREDFRGAVFALFLLASFAPIYGHGKNVLGEVPGLFYFLAGILIFSATAKTVKKSLYLFVLAGVVFGLAMIAKPLYLMLLPPAFILAWLFGRNGPNLKTLLIVIGGAILPIIWWYFAQFGGDSFSAIATIYSGNPSGLPLLPTILENARRFISEPQPVYFLILLGVWFAAVLIKIRRGGFERISFVEKTCLIFGILSLLAYLKTVGYYRYFFPAEFLAILFFPKSLFVIAESLREKVRPVFISGSVCVLFALFIFQVYTTLFHSWVGIDYRGNRTAMLQTVFDNLPEKSVGYFYNVPEAAFFSKFDGYYQYLDFAPTIQRGEETFSALKDGVPDYVVIGTDFWKTSDLFLKYRFYQRVDQYDVLDKI